MFCALCELCHGGLHTGAIVLFSDTAMTFDMTLITIIHTDIGSIDVSELKLVTIEQLA